MPIQTPGTHREVISYHYGPTGSGRKVYIQGSLHADELPGMLVAHCLREQLAQLEAAGELASEIVVVPVCNPIGLAQMLLHAPIGRFDFGRGENFNRHYPDLFEAVKARVAPTLGSDARVNTGLIREAIRTELALVPAVSELSGLRKTLLSLAFDADIVLDLHCDSEAVMHLYTLTPLWPRVEPLARLLQARATLLATESGDSPFDEACSQIWWRLQAAFGPENPVELGCAAVTVELRGTRDINLDIAHSDARAIIDYLRLEGHVVGAAPELPPLAAEATPLAGSATLSAPISGVLAFLKAPGDMVASQDVVAQVIDPLSGEKADIVSHTSGVMYAREARSFVTQGTDICKVAGRVPFRHGRLLSA
ncbi:MAG TPA: succinylglutamate desuccinylase/aspartoacylase family protein [Burkholderiaceae bacterium]|nr:succinylglutamate desuccinylase/aspartoacylase family protein [Burkholderiaceae bacterium]